MDATTGAVRAVYTWGAGGLVSQHLPATQRSLWYAFGPQGETRQLTDANGAVVDTYLYTAYGVPGPTTGSDPNPFRYGGQVGYYTDTSVPSGLILCGARWYNPALARWISRDPIGYEGGDNLYAYYGIDPAGLNPPGGSKVVLLPPQEAAAWVQSASSSTGAPAVRTLSSAASKAGWLTRFGGLALKVVPLLGYASTVYDACRAGNALGNAIADQLYPDAHLQTGADPQVYSLLERARAKKYATVTLYHRGTLARGNGKICVSPGKEFSTGTNKEQLLKSTELQGSIHTLKIPREVFKEWEQKNYVYKVNAYMKNMGRVEEWRFKPQIQGALEQYRVKR